MFDLGSASSIGRRLVSTSGSVGTHCFLTDPECRRHNVLLSVSSNQKRNAYLKERADICGIHKQLTTHLASHI